MLFPEIVELTRFLKDCDYQITVETAGIADTAVFCDLMSISPKLSNSTPAYAAADDSRRLTHEQLRCQPEIVQKLIRRYNYQLKFVVDTQNDLWEIKEYLSQLHGVIARRVFLMPQAVDAAAMTQKADWIIPFCELHGYRYCPRMQIIWYGNKRHT
jgi:7-carboxy-7-deazaguanine synthase